MNLETTRGHTSESRRRSPRCAAFTDKSDPGGAHVNTLLWFGLVYGFMAGPGLGDSENSVDSQGGRSLRSTHRSGREQNNCHWTCTAGHWSLGLLERGERGEHTRI